jgi:hypothetical protein
MTPGCVGLSNSKSGAFPALVRFFTGSKYSHTFLTTFSFKSTSSVQEASSTVQVVPLDRHYRNEPKEQYWLYECTQASESEKEKALEYCFREFAGVKYGTLQLLWFVYARFAKFVGYDVSRRTNWFTDGLICSELVYWYLFNLNDSYRNLLRHSFADTIQAQDIADIIGANPSHFHLIESKE